MVSIQAYLEYIRCPFVHPLPPPTFELLCTIVTKHLDCFMYQNTELFTQGLLPATDRTPGALSIETLFEQFITKKHTGYCFQNSELLAWALEELGFKLTRHLAKVINQSREEFNESTLANFPFSHEIIIVELTDEKWLVDTSFANNSLRNPLKIASGVQKIANDAYWLHLTKDTLRLDMAIDTAWFCLYEVNRQAKSPAEIFNANQALFTDIQKIPIRDDFYKLGTVTANKRKVLCLFPATHAGFFKSYGTDGYKKEQKITTATQLQAIAKKKFNLKIDEHIVQSIFSTTLN